MGGWVGVVGGCGGWVDGVPMKSQAELCTRPRPPFPPFLPKASDRALLTPLLGEPPLPANVPILMSLRVRAGGGGGNDSFV